MASPWGTYQGGGNDNGKDNVVRLPLIATPVRLPHGQQIPPRQWLYGTHLMRGMMSLLVSPGGVGKTQLAMATAVCMATGRSLLGQKVHKRVRSWIFNLEDPMEEMERRLEALMIHHDIKDSELRDWLFMDSGRDRKMCMATIDQDGNKIVYPDKDLLIATARANEIGFIGVDPFIKSHALDENSNPHMDAAATAWAEVAHEANCASLIVHHVRKGPVVDIDSARGGSALVGASRSAMMLTPMSPEEADRLGVLDKDRWRHIRLDDGKANMAPRAEKADWYLMHPIALGNGDDEYPNGDTVTALSKWEPPSVAADATMGDIIAVLEKIGAGLPNGDLYTSSRRGKGNTRWVGNVVMEMLEMSDGQAVALINQWLKNQVLVESTFHSPVTRKEVPGLLVSDSALYGMKEGLKGGSMGEESFQ